MSVYGQRKERNWLQRDVTSEGYRMVLHFSCGSDQIEQFLKAYQRVHSKLASFVKLTHINKSDAFSSQNQTTETSTSYTCSYWTFVFISDCALTRSFIGWVPFHVVFKQLEQIESWMQDTSWTLVVGPAIKELSDFIWFCSLWDCYCRHLTLQNEGWVLVTKGRYLRNDRNRKKQMSRESH